MKRQGILALLAGLLACVSLAHAGTGRMSPEEVPPPLRPWVDWARHNPPAPECPRTASEPEPVHCIWPAGIEMQLSARQGAFTMTVDAFGDGAVELPGDIETWPREVRLDGEPVAVVPANGRPSLRVGPGHHVVAGRFDWQRLPLNLQLPRQVAKVSVTIDGERFTSQPDASGQLWLRAAPDKDGTDDSLSTRVFRQFTDDVPMLSTVRYEFSIAGRQREVRVPHAVLEGFVPLAVEGGLPARIDADGSLKVQARAGSWVLNVTSRRMSPASELQLPEGAGEQEVWSFAPRNAVRVVNLEGPPAVDPKSVGVPAEWAGLPTFVLQPGKSLRIAEVQRGDAGGAADRLQIRRTLWLDFDGGGFSVQDRISGTIGRSWRLDLPEQFALGRVSVNGVDLPVTRSAAGRGVELREASIALEADSRIDSSVREIPASGWTVPLSGWAAELNLPPGWRLIHAAGADSVQGEWLMSWTLWDIFGVLLIAAVTFRVVGPLPALILLAGLVLTWHTWGAPKFMWLALVLFRAIAAAVPANAKLRGWAARGALFSGVLIAVMLVPFAVDQIRQAMYPALGMSYSQATAGMSRAARAPASARPPAPPVAQEAENYVERKLRDEAASLVAPLSREDTARTAASRPDPNLKVQTGPGIPSWRWTVIELASQGPIASGQNLSLTLLPPAGSALWSVLSVLLLGLALWRCWEFDRAAMMRKLRGALSSAAVLGVVAVVGMGATTTDARAQSAFPSEALLGELRTRLLAPDPAPACAPVCADLADMRIEAAGNTITLKLEVHAQARTVVPLPSPGANIRPSSVLAGGQSPALLRDDKGVIWASVRPGITSIEIVIPAHQDEVPVHLPLAPRRVSTLLERWSLSGIDARGLATETLTLSRLRETQAKADKEFAGGADLPPFAEVERHVIFDQTWTVRTVVRRQGPSALQTSVRIPLLAGEAVTDPGIKVEDGEAVVDLAPGASRSFTSVLEHADRLRLVTSTHPGQIERWTVSATPSWHVESSGLAPAVWTSGGTWQPRWQLWPGEAVELTLSRPSGMDGGTLTFDEVQIDTTVGQRSSDASARLRLRSSAGGNHVIGLPDGAELLSVRIDGQVQPLRAEKGRLALPITPGEHSVQLDWRDVSAASNHYRSSQLDLGAQAVNASITLAVPQDRVVLFTKGPLVGPAVLLWGVLIVVVAIAAVLSRVVPGPLGMVTWILLGVGLVQSSVASAFFVIGWFVLLAIRRNYVDPSPWRFNLFQALLLIFTLLAASALLSALRQGLLGYPEMLVTGNGSTAFSLRWYLDRLDGTTPSAEFFSIPVFAYRLMMLGWALWLAIALTGWVRWAWSCVSAGGSYWRPLDVPKMLSRTTKATVATGVDESGRPGRVE
ncbi:hypothetical protein U5817_15925 [Aromatoleum evansii]|uniref:Uncharacterized protein n=1 Tax=Aromatoleum evansii TaxID=59406 RepID=A0ABZ1AG34_AROEV|nr:hypothetical protein U5817_15925 [Aromatoleum evansii]